MFNIFILITVIAFSGIIGHLVMNRMRTGKMPNDKVFIKSIVKDQRNRVIAYSDSNLVLSNNADCKLVYVDQNSNSATMDVPETVFDLFAKMYTVQKTNTGASVVKINQYMATTDLNIMVMDHLRGKVTEILDNAEKQMIQLNTAAFNKVVTSLGISLAKVDESKVSTTSFITNLDEIKERK